ncbi:MAG: DEAD/DEAH box helicase [Bacteroidaceae bacterium]
MNTQTILSNLNLDRLSEMQENAIALIRNNINAVILAPTGSGKTLAFLLPLVESVDTDNPAPQAVVVAPTRELALQTHKVLCAMKTQCRSVVLHGGKPASLQHRQIETAKPHIIVATPGRLNDHIAKGNIFTAHIKTLVVDEFDKMFELKFQDQLRQLLDQLPSRKRCILISATDMKEIPAFVAFRHHPPATLDCLDHNNLAPSPQISHHIVRSPQKDKIEILHQLLCSLGNKQSVVFVNYREAAERVARMLADRGHSVTMFHGGMEQQDRETALSLFSNHSANILISTDLAARGIDIPTLQNVIHYHPAQNAEAFTHRCGRTARWSANGNSYIIIGPDETIPTFCSECTEATPGNNTPPPAKPLWTTLYIGRGKGDKLSKTDIVGFLCKIGKLKADQIGNIDIKPRHSYVAVSQPVLKTLLRNIAGEKIKKMSTIIEPIKTSHLIPKLK